MMQVDSRQNFTTTFSMDRTPQEAFEAVTDRLGGEFDYHYQDVHRCRMRVTELVPGRKAAWLVLDDCVDFIEDQAEWKGTEVVFEISERDGGAEVRTGEGRPTRRRTGSPRPTSTPRCAPGAHPGPPVRPAPSRTEPEVAASTGESAPITGANGGIGRPLLEEALRRDVQQVYAGTRESIGGRAGTGPPTVTLGPGADFEYDDKEI